MFNKLGRYSDIGLLIGRVGIGLSFVFIHGLPKLQGGPKIWEQVGSALANFGIKFFPLGWGFMATMSEFLGGLLLIFGLFFRPATVFMIITMLIAFLYLISRKDMWGFVIHPLQLALILFVFFILGPGKYSLDYLIFNKKGSE